MRLCNCTDERLRAHATNHLKVSQYLGGGKVVREVAADLASAIDELIDRRAEAESELRQLERSLAFEHASQIIDGACAPVEGREDWFDIDDYHQRAEPDVIQAVAYLRMRGLLQEDNDDPRNIVSIRYESEATA